MVPRRPLSHSESLHPKARRTPAASLGCCSGLEPPPHLKPASAFPHGVHLMLTLGPQRGERFGDPAAECDQAVQPRMTTRAQSNKQRDGVPSLLPVMHL